MSVREYVGARYVPIVVGEWDNSKTYEPLMVVTYQGDSYTSRQYVPVGIDIQNEQYWIESANYNAQVDAYRKEVQAFDGRITANATAIDAEKTRAEGAERANATAIDAEKTRAEGAERANATAIAKLTEDLDTITPFDASPQSGSNKGVTSNGLYNAINKPNDVLVWIGDSYSDPDIVPVDWVPIVARSINAQLHTFAKSGAGFTNGRLFQTQIESAINDTSFDNNKVKNIVIYGGNNDIGHWISHNSDYSWYKIFRDFFKAIHDNFPNATTHIAVPNVNGNLTRSSYYGYCTKIYEAASEANSKNHILHNVDGWQNFVGYPNGYLSETNEHPGPVMCYELVRIFVDAISGSGEFGKLNTISVTENIPGVIVGQSASKFVSVGGLLPFFVIITAPADGIPANTDIFTIGSKKQLYNAYNWKVGNYNFYIGDHGNVRSYNPIPEGETISINIPAMNWRS